MKKIKNILLILLVLLTATSLLVLLYFKTKKEPEDLINYESEIWDIDLLRKFSSYVEEIYPSDKTYLKDDNDSIIITLIDLKKKYKKDISMFNTKKVSCDTENSTITIVKDSGIEIRKVDLFCERLDE